MSVFTDIHHVGYLVDNMDETVAAYEKLLGGKLLSRSHNAAKGMTNAFVQMGNAVVELIEKADKTEFAGSKCQVLHHVGYLVPDIDAALRELQGQGIELIDKEPWVNAMGWKVAYFKGGERLGAAMHVMQV